MSMPFFASHLQPDEWEAFEGEYAEWLALVEASVAEDASLPRGGGPVPAVDQFLRADSTRKARRVRRLASRLVGREVR
jgi:hypothetical protein